MNSIISVLIAYDQFFKLSYPAITGLHCEKHTVKVSKAGAAGFSVKSATIPFPKACLSRCLGFFIVPSAEAPSSRGRTASISAFTSAATRTVHSTLKILENYLLFKNSWLLLFQPHLPDDNEMYHIEIKMVNGQASNKLDTTNSLDFGKIEKR